MNYKSFLSCIRVMFQKKLLTDVRTKVTIISMTGLCFLIDRVLNHVPTLYLLAGLCFVWMLAPDVDLPEGIHS